VHRPDLCRLLRVRGPPPVQRAPGPVRPGWPLPGAVLSAAGLLLGAHRFAPAYLVSATACVGLITFYVRHVLGTLPHAAAFGGALAALYGLLYGILSSEDYAL